MERTSEKKTGKTTTHMALEAVKNEKFMDEAKAKRALRVTV